MRPTIATINLSAIRHNFRVTKTLVSNSYMMAVIKANAYGHGLVTVAKALAYDCDAFAVAFIDEAIELRQQGITQPILLLEGAFSSDDVIQAANLQCWLMATSIESVNTLVNTAINSSVDVWLKVDTGMHRLGIMPEQFQQAFERLNHCSHVDNIVVTSHLSQANDLINNRKQLDCLASLAQCGKHHHNYHLSIANSAAIMNNLSIKQTGRGYDWCRPGIMLYGISPLTSSGLNKNSNSDNNTEPVRLKPAMTLTSSIISIRDITSGESVGYEATWTASKDSKIATIAIGYGDGYPRAAANGTPVWIDGATVPIVGVVSMDLITLDISDHPNVNAIRCGEPVELWGNNLDINLVAKHANTISYECLAQLSPRVPRVYINDVDS